MKFESDSKLLSFELSVLSWPGLAENVAIAEHLPSCRSSHPRVAHWYRRQVVANSLRTLRFRGRALDMPKGLIAVVERWA